MLPDLLQILETLVLSPHDGGHPTKSCSLQLLASVQRVSKLQQTDIVLGHVVNEMSGSIDLSEGKLVMILTTMYIAKPLPRFRSLNNVFTLSYRTFMRSA